MSGNLFHRRDAIPLQHLSRSGYLLRNLAQPLSFCKVYQVERQDGEGVPLGHDLMYHFNKLVQHNILLDFLVFTYYIASALFVKR